MQPNSRAITWGGAVQGVQGIRVQVQAQQMNGRQSSWLRTISITGSAGREVREAEERVAGALTALRVPCPQGPMLVNLSPAGAAKLGTSLDLPIAMAVCQALGMLPRWSERLTAKHTFIGEMDLYGGLRPTPGALAIAFTAPPDGVLIVPDPNKQETSLLRADGRTAGIRILVAHNLTEVLTYSQGGRTLPEYKATRLRVEPLVTQPINLNQIKGQKQARRAIEIAAAGGHSVMLRGPAGCGKTLLAQAMAGILPALTQSQKVELTRIYSAAGRLREGSAVTRRPFRAVHYTASPNSLIGGGTGRIVPGEISLAHLGVLLLDELPEFHRNTLEALRQPIEAGEITISRVGISVTLPCRFQLVASCNPCPCGYNGIAACEACKGFGPVGEICPTCQTLRQALCRCSPSQIARYQAKLSRPLLDRIDLYCNLGPLATGDLLDGSSESSETVRQRVQRARQIQTQRFTGSLLACNAQIPPGSTAEDCQLTTEAKDALTLTATERLWSARRMDRAMRIARTIADLCGVTRVCPEHIREAGEFSA